MGGGLMNRVIIISLIVLSSCGVSKRAVKTEEKSQIVTESKKSDSTTLKLNKQDFLLSIIESVDLSKINITIYNPPDTSGKQSIDYIVEQSNNTKSTTTSIELNNASGELVTGSEETTRQDAKIETTINDKTKRGGIPFKVYLWGVVSLVLLGGAVFILKRFI
jgi:hypothetical protein